MRKHTICCGNTAETFDTFEKSGAVVVRTQKVAHKEPVVAVKKPLPAPKPAPPEQLRLKFGKITVQVKNAQNVSVREVGDGEMVVKLS